MVLLIIYSEKLAYETGKMPKTLTLEKGREPATRPMAGKQPFMTHENTNLKSDVDHPSKGRIAAIKQLQGPCDITHAPGFLELRELYSQYKKSISDMPTGPINVIYLICDPSYEIMRREPTGIERMLRK